MKNLVSMGMLGLFSISTTVFAMEKAPETTPKTIPVPGRHYSNQTSSRQALPLPPLPRNTTERMTATAQMGSEPAHAAWAAIPVPAVSAGSSLPGRHPNQTSPRQALPLPPLPRSTTEGMTAIFTTGPNPAPEEWEPISVPVASSPQPPRLVPPRLKPARPIPKQISLRQLVISREAGKAKKAQERRESDRE